MYQVLYRKYRPKNLKEIVGQKEIVQTLMNEFKNNQLNHAYLFAGPRGTGKTSIAKIIGKMVNCSNPNGIEPCEKCENCSNFNNKQASDIIEIDAASNNGVDEIRELKNKVNLAPTTGKYKVYIIDEVHMLTTSAFNALLKTLEEPPSGVIFILATTEPRKIPITILSRCQRFNFKKIGLNQMKERLKLVSEKEKISVSDEALDLIVNFSDGGMRDALSLLDQLVAYSNNKIDISEVYSLTGTLNENAIFELLNSVYSKNVKNCYEIMEKYVDGGKNFFEIVDEIISFLKNVLIYLNCSNFNFSQEQCEMYKKILNIVDDKIINESIDAMLDVRREIKNTDNEQLIFELGIIRMINLVSPVENNDKLDVITKKDDQKQKKNITKESNLNNEEYLDELKKVRINNALALFNKKDLVSFKQKISDISDFLDDVNYSSVCSLILDGELKAKGDKNLIFVFKDRSLSQLFNSKISKVDSLLKKFFNDDYKSISVFDDEWNLIKEEFNKSIKQNSNKFEVQEEPTKQMFVKKNASQVDNEIDGMFGEIIEYE